MPSVGCSTCPNLARLFRCTLQPDPAVVEVANAIYEGGKVDGVAGLEVVAHIIQNRCSHSAFPSEPRSVVRSGWMEQFPNIQDAPLPTQRRLYHEARRLAQQLVHPPQRLRFSDPTGGALYFDPRGPACQHSVLPMAEPGEPGSVPAATLREAEVPEDDDGNIEPPRRAMPQSTTWCAQQGPSPRSTGPATTMPSLQSPQSSRTTGRSGSRSPSSVGAVVGAVPTSGRTFPGVSSGRRRSVSSLLQRGLPDGDGYHDMILPCGLFQEEVIELMYRDLNPEDYDLLNKLDERVSKKNTMGRNAVERLPRRLAKECECTQCGICLAEVGPKVQVAQLPCRHAFHPACISRWLTQCKSSCPLCSTPLDEARQSSGPASSSDGLQVCFL
mmetsp:Transcript_46610/g.101524  ORF Transcript_46610/g.101524 Transcript_46610/m.101524 type:complete len:385 (+) Transcript_46610:88-1242(+)